jgi:hypothetical protein
MKVGLLTLEQKNLLVSKEFQQNCFFNPVQDADNNWVITTEEMYHNQDPDYSWLLTLPLVDYNPKQLPPIGL